MATKPMLDHTIRKNSDHEYSNIIMRNFNNVSNAVDFFDFILFLWDSQVALDKKKNLHANVGEDPLEKEMATHSSIHAWETP